MKHYIFAKLNFTEFDWIKSYQENVPDIIEQAGGKILARTHKTEVSEGSCDQPHVILLVEFPSKKSADDFYTSEEYRPYLEARLAGSVSEIHSFAGEDSVGTSS
ncbi:MAG: hypothetical protein CMN84_01815 [Spongiibacteraceae bacterium]|jgi:uncharacterized protein (DUF1330 family)|nr:hypothetical protein [Spongiibacteraceae bacterium]